MSDDAVCVECGAMRCRGAGRRGLYSPACRQADAQNAGAVEWDAVVPRAAPLGIRARGLVLVLSSY